MLNWVLPIILNFICAMSVIRTVCADQILKNNAVQSGEYSDERRAKFAKGSDGQLEMVVKKIKRSPASSAEPVSKIPIRPGANRKIQARSKKSIL